MNRKPKPDQKLFEPSAPNASVLADAAHPEPYSTDEVTDRIILGDALKVLPKLPEDAYDAVFIDPPYFCLLYTSPSPRDRG